MPLLPVPSLVLVALVLAGPAPAFSQDSWEDVELPRGFLLELASGRVTNRPSEAGLGLVYRAGLLESPAPLRRLPPSGSVRAQIERGAGEALIAPEARAGDELLYELGQEGWGYLRLLEVSPERLRIERVHADPAARDLARRPLDLTVRQGEGGLVLAWSDAGLRPGGSFRVERRLLPRGPQDPDLGWEVLTEVPEATWLDETASSTRVQEYRVRSLEPAVSLGARARGVRHLLGPEGAVPVRRGMALCLLTGREGTGRIDVRIQHANESLVQLVPGPGVRLHNLKPGEEEAWSLPGIESPEWSTSGVFAGPGRSLAAHLPEGIYVRLAVEIDPGSEPRLQRQIDLAGGRLFPPPPPRAKASWDSARGLLLVLDAAPDALEPGLPRPELVVEVEEGFESGSWRLLESRPAARELELGHLLPAGLARLRLRYRLPGGELSLAGPATGVLAGDDGGEGAEELLERALGDLSSPDYAERRRAQGILETLGARSLPRLRQALGSEDPELAAAARELLGRLAGEGHAGASPGASEGEAIAPLILRAQAQARGLVGDPPEGWFDARPARRALAILTQLARDPAGELEPWRELAAGSDPDPRVRRLASLAPTLRPPPAGPDWVARLLAEPWEAAPPAGWLADSDPEGAARSLARGLEVREPWAALARLAAVHDLGGAAGTPDQPRALRRAQLVLGLLERHAEDPQPAFLEAARLVVLDPCARLAAVRELADRLCAPPAAGREVRELGQASGEELAAALAELEGDESQAVDLVLPAGVYEIGGAGGMLRIGARGLRLIGRGEVVLRAPLYVTPGGEVVLEGLRLAPPSGIALHVGRSSVTLVDCVIVPAQLGVQISEGLLTLSRTQMVSESGAGTIAGIRAAGESLVLVRESSIDVGGPALSGARLALVERSVLVSAAGVALQAARDGEGWVLDAFLAGSNAAVSGLSGGLLEGGLLASEGQVATQLGARVAACPEHLLLQGPPGDLGERSPALGCSLGR